MPQLLTQDAIHSIYESARDILSTLGIEFEMDGARQLLRKHGAALDGKRVLIPPGLLDRSLAMMPTHHETPANGRRLVAASPFCNAPMIADSATGRMRRGTIGDAVKMYQLAETSGLYESVNPGVADPAGNDSDDPFVSQVAMLLKYSDKWPALGLYATRSNAKNGDVRTSAVTAIQLIKEIREDHENPVTSQVICPLSPLSYGEESLINLDVLAGEGQNITISPCTLSFMTGPESLMGIVTHDIAVSLAGAVYIQLLKPGTGVSFSNGSTMTDMRTMQPAYGCPEYLYTQIMFYEVCRSLGMNAVLCGCLSDGTRTDYQAGVESCFTAMAPFTMADVTEVFCYPGHLAAFSGGSFEKMICDEEMLANCNRLLRAPDLSPDPLLMDKLARSLETKSFLTTGDIKIYRKEHRLTTIFDKKGLGSENATPEPPTDLNVKKEIERRCRAYQLPERTKTQKKALQQYLPGPCKY